MFDPLSLQACRPPPQMVCFIMRSFRGPMWPLYIGLEIKGFKDVAVKPLNVYIY